MRMKVTSGLSVSIKQVEEPRIARLVDGHILMGRDLGITTIQVSSILFSLQNTMSSNIHFLNVNFLL